MQAGGHEFESRCLHQLEPERSRFEVAPHLENCIERKTKENKTDKIKRKDKKGKVLQSEVHKFQREKGV